MNITKNRMNLKTLLCAVGIAALAVGCLTDKIHKTLRVAPVPVSDFLPNHELLVRQPDTFPFHFFYLSDKASCYENVYIAPVNIDYLKKSEGWAKFDKALAGKLGVHAAEMREFMRQAYRKAFEQAGSDSRLKVVEDRNLPNTLVLEPAVIAVKPTKAELNTLGTAASFVIPGIGVVTSLMSAGSITVECLVRDARTNEIVAMYADTEKDPRAVLSPAQFTWNYSARINIKTIAKQTAQVLSAKDYRTIRRDFPIRFTALIKDASL